MSSNTNKDVISHLITSLSEIEVKASELHDLHDNLDLPESAEDLSSGGVHEQVPAVYATILKDIVYGIFADDDTYPTKALPYLRALNNADCDVLTLEMLSAIQHHMDSSYKLLLVKQDADSYDVFLRTDSEQARIGQIDDDNYLLDMAATVIGVSTRSLYLHSPSSAAQTTAMLGTDCFERWDEFAGNADFQHALVVDQPEALLSRVYIVNDDTSDTDDLEFLIENNPHLYIGFVNNGQVVVESLLHAVEFDGRIVFPSHF